jgi:hypothetical protein
MNDGLLLETLKVLVTADAAGYRKELAAVQADSKQMADAIIGDMNRATAALGNIPREIESVSQSLRKTVAHASAAAGSSKATLGIDTSALNSAQTDVHGVANEIHGLGKELVALAAAGQGPLAPLFQAMKAEQQAGRAEALKAHFAGAMELGREEGTQARQLAEHQMQQSMLLVRQDSLRFTRMKEGFNVAAEGAMKLGRAIALSGAMGQESLDKLLPTLLKVQAGMDFGRGGMNLAYGLSRAGATGTAGAGAAAVAMFAASVTAATYAISGAKGVQEEYNNLVELGAHLLKAISFGTADYTEETKRATQSQADLSRVTASGAEYSKTLIATADGRRDAAFPVARLTLLQPLAPRRKKRPLPRHLSKAVAEREHTRCIVMLGDELGTDEINKQGGKTNGKNKQTGMGTSVGSNQGLLVSEPARRAAVHELFGHASL